ncbi:MAG: type II toxin-antitoxin system RelE/ParE family toxin [Blastocatellia bacterium]|nr:type II toxin-antitoxin system RelE/ParE family toxin [Blastocatellia bacterium]
MTVVLLETALVELEEAVAYYESQSAELGDSFLDEFLRSIQLIQGSPTAARSGGYWGAVDAVPLVVYSAEDQQIVIVAVSHFTGVLG